MKKLYVAAQRPNALYEAIIKQVRDGKIATWVIDKEGDFIHGSLKDGVPQGQWVGRAWLRPKVEGTTIVFTLVRPLAVATLAQDVEGVYLGRFAEMLVNHFPNDFDSLVIKN